MRFFFVGIIGAIVELLLFSILMRWGLQIPASNFLAFHCAFVLCFFLHFFYTHKTPFSETRGIAGGFLKYSLLMYGQLIVGTFVLWLLIDQFDWMAEIAKIVQIGVVTPISYAIQRHIVFRPGAIG